MFLLVFLFLLLVVTPFVLGFFEHGSEWVLYPQMYLGRYLLYMPGLGYKVKMWIHKLTSK